MENGASQSRALWLSAGLVAGLCISYFWPHEPALAVATDRSERFAMLTTQVSLVGNIVNTEAIFVLDFLTGQLHGRVLDTSNGVFAQSYFRNIANDFQVDPADTNVQYAIVAGGGQLSSSRRGRNPASSLIYVGEMNSGKVICYAFPFNQRPVRTPTAPLEIVDTFQFRETAAP